MADPAGPRRGLRVAELAGCAEEHTAALYRFARSLVRSPDLAEDLVQQTFLRALERREQYLGGSVLAWLRRILHNLAVDDARRRHGETPLDEDRLAAAVEELWRQDDYSVDPEVVAERAQTREQLEDALIRLPYASRAVLVLHDEEGWSLPEIARTLEISLPAAKQRLRRGRMMLVTALASAGQRSRGGAAVPMRCWDARREVSDYLDGGLDPEARHRLETHLARCTTCPPLYAALVGVRAELGGQRDPDSVIPPDLAARVAASLLGTGAPSGPG